LAGPAEALKVTTGGLRAVYRTLELPGTHPLKDAHAARDAAVLAASRRGTCWPNC
jgi:hypothetical protein